MLDFAVNDEYFPFNINIVYLKSIREVADAFAARIELTISDAYSLATLQPKPHEFLATILQGHWPFIFRTSLKNSN